MPLIDQRILIDAPPEVVWQVISDQNQLAQWHAGVTSVSVLTTQQRGTGVRRRCTLTSGKDVIEEITSWVEGMGYEYQRVEGGPYRNYMGRLRLQSGPDGTSVQWTITYTPRGLIGGLRDRLRGRKTLAEIVTASLRQLRRQVDALGRRMDDEARARAMIRERMSAAERAAAYAARHPAEGDAPAAVAPSGPPAPPPPPAEPSFVRDLASDEPPVDPTADTQPQEPVAIDAPPEEPAAQAPETPPAPARPASDTLTIEEIPLHQRVTPARGIPSVQPSSQVIERPVPPPPEPPVPPPAEIKPPAVTPVPPPPEIKPPPPAPEAGADPYQQFRRPPEAPRPTSETPGAGKPAPTPADAAPAPAETAKRPGLPPQTPITDTGEISIWDVFGIRRPSEQDADALDELIQSIRARHMAEQRLQGRFGRSARVRVREGAAGLRLQLALRASGVRLSGPLSDRTGRKE